jgi:ribosome-binding ATPase YchF (GTP1/OBG family)
METTIKSVDLSDFFKKKKSKKKEIKKLIRKEIKKALLTEEQTEAVGKTFDVEDIKPRESVVEKEVEFVQYLKMDVEKSFVYVLNSDEKDMYPSDLLFGKVTKYKEDKKPIIKVL